MGSSQLGASGTNRGWDLMQQKKRGLTQDQRYLAWTIGITLTCLMCWFLWLYWQDGGKRKKDQVFNDAGRYLKKRYDGIRKTR